jgi:hypothetical protein
LALFLHLCINDRHWLQTKSVKKTLRGSAGFFLGEFSHFFGPENYDFDTYTGFF